MGLSTPELRGHSRLERRQLRAYNQDICPEVVGGDHFDNLRDDIPALGKVCTLSHKFELIGVGKREQTKLRMMEKALLTRDLNETTRKEHFSTMFLPEVSGAWVAMKGQPKTEQRDPGAFSSFPATSLEGKLPMSPLHHY